MLVQVRPLVGPPPSALRRRCLGRRLFVFVRFWNQASLRTERVWVALYVWMNVGTYHALIHKYPHSVWKHYTHIYTMCYVGERIGLQERGLGVEFKFPKSSILFILTSVVWRCREEYYLTCLSLHLVVWFHLLASVFDLVLTSFWFWQFASIVFFFIPFRH